MAGRRRRALGEASLKGSRLRAACTAAILCAIAQLSCRSAGRHTEQAPPALSSAPQVAAGPAQAVNAAPAQASVTRSPEPESGSAVASGAESAPVALPPLTAASPFVVLPVPGFRDAVVSVPRGATEPRRIAVALHGNFDRPEWQCEVWRQITQGEVFVLCPRGVPRGDVPKEQDRWEWSTLAKTQAELAAALGALRERFGAHAHPGPIIFTGFSLGAILGARLLEDPSLGIGAAVLTEGGYAGWTAAKAKRVGASLTTVLFACGQTACRNSVRQSLPLLEKSGLHAVLVADVKAGHTYDGNVALEIQKQWPDLLASMNAPP